MKDGTKHIVYILSAIVIVIFWAVIYNTASATNFYGESPFYRRDLTALLQNNTWKLGIGTTTPYGKFSIWGTGTTTGVTFQVTNSASTSLFTILDNGSISLGGVSYTWPATAGSNNQVLKTNGAGTLSWTTQTGGGGGGSGQGWATTTNPELFYMDSPFVGVLNGSATSTTGNALEVVGSGLFRNALTSYGVNTAPYFTATSTTATSTFPYFTSTQSNVGTVVGGTWKGTAIGDAYLTKTGDWTGTFDGQEGTYYLNAGNLTNFGTPFYTFFSATNTDALAQGSTNKYWSNTLFDNRLSATTTLPNLTTLLGLTNSTTTRASFNYASSTLWYGGGMQTCDATTGKLTWANGQFACGTDYNTGGGGSGNVATSTAETAGYLPYWTSTNATPATLGQVATTTLTASSPLSLSQPINVIGASASVLTISTAGDWTGTLDGWEGATLFSGKVSTSSVPSLGQLSYWTGNGTPSTLGSVATTTLTATGPLALSQPINVLGGSASTLTCTEASSGVAGCLSSTAFDTFNNKQATISATFPITLSGATIGFGGLSTSTAAVVGNIPYFSGVNTFANMATTSLTATYPLSFSQSMSVIGSTPSVASLAFGTTTSNTWASTQTFSAIAGAIDAGGATSFEIPNGASPTVDATGECALDTTSDQFVCFGASAKKVYVPFYTTAFSMSTTTAWTATSTRLLAPAVANMTLISARCETTTGTLNVSVYDGTNRADLLNASTTIGNFTFSTNNTFTAGESIRVDVGTPASTPVEVSCRLKFSYDSD